MKNSISKTRSALVILAVAAVSLSLSGCGGLGAFFGLFIQPLIPPETIPAEHDMRQARLLIWIDDFSSEQETPLLRRELTQKIGDMLIENEAVASVIPYSDVAYFRQIHPDFPQMSLAQIGAELQADQVLHFWVNSFAFHDEAGEDYYRINLTASLKIVDVATQQRVWPSDQSHRGFAYTDQLRQGSGQTFENQLIRELCEHTASVVAPWFYDHSAASPAEQERP
ncbi:MAG: hypothetical protein JW936_06890 [Sedimentisphaerales bacterium]|nr:hypothetical protein [Sedimentisphaerales bacterium]